MIEVNEIFSSSLCEYYEAKGRFFVPFKVVKNNPVFPIIEEEIIYKVLESELSSFYKGKVLSRNTFGQKGVLFGQYEDNCNEFDEMKSNPLDYDINLSIQFGHKVKDACLNLFQLSQYAQLKFKNHSYLRGEFYEDTSEFALFKMKDQFIGIEYYYGIHHTIVSIITKEGKFYDDKLFLNRHYSEFDLVELMNLLRMELKLKISKNDIINLNKIVNIQGDAYSLVDEKYEEYAEI